jgi:RNA polymerase sigma-70 factor (ECF subfamily)
MAAIQTEDEIAFAVLYERYADLVYSTSLHVLSDPDLAEDSTQDVFLRLWRRPELYVPERGRFVSWLISVARNRAVDEVRIRGRRRKREVATIGLPGEDPGQPSERREDDPLATTQLNAERDLVRRALRDLPEDQRRALQLAYFGGLTHQEIANALNQPLGTVKTRIRLGLQKLRRALEDKV